MKTNLLSEKKVVITVAITGGIHGKWANAAIPITPKEQAQDAHDCYNAGASVLHLHVRGKDGQNTTDINVYNESISLIGNRCPIIRQIGNGIGARMDDSGNIIGATLEERINLLTINPKPEMFTINGGTFEFRTKYGGMIFDNPQTFNDEFISKCQDKNIEIEIEVYDLSHIENVMEFVSSGRLKLPLHFSIVLGIQGGAPATAENLVYMVNQLPEGSSWQVVTVGKYHVRSTILAMSMGGNVRTGLEDTIYYKRNEPAESNAQLVERMVRLAREMGREPASVDEAKEILGIGIS